MSTFKLIMMGTVLATAFAASAQAEEVRFGNGGFVTIVRPSSPTAAEAAYAKQYVDPAGVRQRTQAQPSGGHRQ
jgi:hypothetical protein